MDRLTSMAVFVRAVEAGSFRRASHSLGITPQMVGAHVRFLEDRLGARLLHRTTRRSSPTDSGLAFLERCKAILAEVAAAEAAAAETNGALRGIVRITAPRILGNTVLTPVLAEFMNLHPGVTVDLHLSDRLVDLIAERVDLAVRIGPLEDSTLIARRLPDHRILLCAAPAHLETHGAPAFPHDLARHAGLVFSWWSGASWAEWPFIVAGERVAVTPIARMIANDARTLLAAALRGLGFAMLPEVLTRDAIASGRLIEVLPGCQGPAREVHLLFAAHPSRRLRTLIDFIVAAMPNPPN